MGKRPSWQAHHDPIATCGNCRRSTLRSMHAAPHMRTPRRASAKPRTCSLSAPAPDKTAAAATSAGSRQKEVELEAETSARKSRRKKRSSYSGSIQKPKELTDIQADIVPLNVISPPEDRTSRRSRGVETSENTMHASAAAEPPHGRRSGAKSSPSCMIALSEHRMSCRAEGPAAGSGGVRGTWQSLKMHDRLRAAHRESDRRLDRNLCLGCRISLPQPGQTKRGRGARSSSAPTASASSSA